MKYSVIIPVYNAEKTIAKCVDSLNRQPFKDFEIILVDDGSNDSSLSICKSIEKQSNNIISYSKLNGGPGSARNFGMDRSSGEYVLFVDSDDYVQDDYFKEIERLPEDDFVSFDIKGENGCYSKYGKISIEDFVKSRDGSPVNKRFKRSILQQFNIYFPEDIFVGEDAVFCLRYALFCKTFYKSNAKIYCYNRNNLLSVTKSNELEDYKKSIQIYKYEFESLELCNAEKEVKEKLIRHIDYNYCRTMFACLDDLYDYSPKLSKAELKCYQKKIIDNFRTACKESIEPVSITHAFMRLCVMNKLLVLSQIIVKAYRILR